MSLVTKSTDCSICLEQIVADPSYLRCMHSFHRPCIDLWLSRRNTCPMCRTRQVEMDSEANDSFADSEGSEGSVEEEEDEEESYASGQWSEEETEANSSYDEETNFSDDLLEMEDAAIVHQTTEATVSVLSQNQEDNAYNVVEDESIDESIDESMDDSIVSNDDDEEYDYDDHMISA